MLVVEASLPAPAPPPEAAAAMKRKLIADLRAMPGVEAVGETFIVPLDGNNSSSVVWLDGAPRPRARSRRSTASRAATSRRSACALLAGRDISRHRHQATSPFVAVVNETFARTFLSGRPPIGRRFRVEASPSTPERLYEIVGLVPDAKYQRLRDGAPSGAFVAIAQRGGAVAGGTLPGAPVRATAQSFTPGGPRDAGAGRSEPALRRPRP